MAWPMQGFGVAGSQVSAAAIGAGVGAGGSAREHAVTATSNRASFTRRSCHTSIDVAAGLDARDHLREPAARVGVALEDADAEAGRVRRRFGAVRLDDAHDHDRAYDRFVVVVELELERRADLERIDARDLRVEEQAVLGEIAGAEDQLLAVALNLYERIDAYTLGAAVPRVVGHGATIRRFSAPRSQCTAGIDVVAYRLTPGNQWTSAARSARRSTSSTRVDSSQVASPSSAPTAATCSRSASARRRTSACPRCKASSRDRDRCRRSRRRLVTKRRRIPWAAVARPTKRRRPARRIARTPCSAPARRERSAMQ